MSLEAINSSLMLLVFVTFVSLIFILNIILYRPILSFMQKREQVLQGQDDQILGEQEEIEKIKQEAAEVLINARLQARQIVDQARDEAQKLYAQKFEKAQEEIRVRFEALEDELLKQQNALHQDLQKDCQVLSVCLQEKLNAIGVRG